MPTLEELAQKHRTDKFDHHYLPHYRDHLDSSFTDEVILEIGVAGGASLRMWQEYFPTAEVVGIENKTGQGNYQDLTVVYGDATLSDTYKTIDFNKVGVVIDDGSHQSAEILKAFNIIWPQLRSESWYVIEDLGTQFAEACGGDAIKGSAALWKLHSQLSLTFRGVEVSELHAYEEIIFMRKK